MAAQDKWRLANLFSPYYGLTWSEEADPVAWAITQEYRASLLDHLLKDGKGILFYGSPGTGKTLLAHIVADAVLDLVPTSPYSTKRMLRAFTVQGYLNQFRISMNAMDLVRSGKATDQTVHEYHQAEETIRHSLGRTKFLLIDDIGKEHTTATGYAQHQIDRLIRARGNRGLPTIITSNADSPDQLADMYGPSLASFLRQVCVLCPVTGLDHRLHGEG